MAKSTALRAGAMALATGLLVAACSGGSGGAGPVDSNVLPGSSNAAPTGIAGASGSAHGSASNSKSAKASGSQTASHGSSTTPAHGASSSSHHGGGGGHTSSSAPPPDNGCRSSAPPLSSDPSKASITVCKAVNLSSSQVLTITGHSFKPNEALLATQCRYLGENADNYGLSDCNIGNIITFKPAVTTRSDGNGNVGPIQLTVKSSFKHVDCTKVQCLISVAVPVQKSSLDNPHVLIYFS